MIQNVAAIIKEIEKTLSLSEAKKKLDGQSINRLQGFVALYKELDFYTDLPLDPTVTELQKMTLIWRGKTRGEIAMSGHRLRQSLSFSYLDTEKGRLVQTGRQIRDIQQLHDQIDRLSLLLERGQAALANRESLPAMTENAKLFLALLAGSPLSDYAEALNDALERVVSECAVPNWESTDVGAVLQCGVLSKTLKDMVRREAAYRDRRLASLIGSLRQSWQKLGDVEGRSMGRVYDNYNFLMNIPEDPKVSELQKLTLVMRRESRGDIAMKSDSLRKSLAESFMNWARPRLLRIHDVREEIKNVRQEIREDVRVRDMFQRVVAETDPAELVELASMFIRKRHIAEESTIFEATLDEFERNCRNTITTIEGNDSDM